MSNTSKALVLIIAPELSTVGDSLFSTVLVDVANRISATEWGKSQEEAQRYLTAHILSTTGAINNVEGIEEDVGDLSIKFPVSSSEDLGRTRYGKHFQTIKKSKIIPFLVV